MPELPLRHLEGAGSHGVFTKIHAVFVDRFLGDGKGEVDGHHVEKCRIGLDQFKTNGVWIDDGDAREMIRFSGHHVIIALDAPEKALTGTLSLGIDGPFNGIFDVFGDQFSAVVKFYVLSDLEGIDLSVR